MQPNCVCVCLKGHYVCITRFIICLILYSSITYKIFVQCYGLLTMPKLLHIKYVHSSFHHPPIPLYWLLGICLHLVRHCLIYTEILLFLCVVLTSILHTSIHTCALCLILLIGCRVYYRYGRQAVDTSDAHIVWKLMFFFYLSVNTNPTVPRI